MEKPRMYLDYAASTPLDTAVAAAVAAVQTFPGNPSSAHAEGRFLRVIADESRAKVGALFGVAPGAVTFTSGATEANAMAILGTFRAAQQAIRQAANPPRVIVSAIEHESVRANVSRLEAEGAIVDVIPAGRNGVVRVEDVAAAITPDTVLVSVMWANNVLGTIQPVGKIGEAVRAERERRSGAPRANATASVMPLTFHCDAVQAVTTLPTLPAKIGIDLLTVSAHKMYGPKGIGALICLTAHTPSPLWGGGGQEAGVRNGTENLAAIFGFGTAAEILAARQQGDAVHAAALKSRLTEGLARAAPTIDVIGSSDSVPATLFLRHPTISGDKLALLLDADGFAVSAGSACDAGTKKRPATLAAVLGESGATHGGIRVSFGRFTTASDIDALIHAIARRLAPAKAAQVQGSVTVQTAPATPAAQENRSL